MVEFASIEWFDNLEMYLPDQIEHNSKRILRLPPDVNDIDLRKQRPLIKFSSVELLDFAEKALSRQWPARELATIALIEAEKRRTKTKNSISNLFSDIDIPSVPWLEAAQKIASLNRSTTNIGNVNGAVYCVLIDGFTQANDYYGLYVGSTSLTNFDGYKNRQAARAARHFQGIQASSRVKNRGLEPLWSLNLFFHKVSGQRQSLRTEETRIHNFMDQVVHRVLGDTI